MMSHRLLLALALAIGAATASCAPGGGAQAGGPELSSFALDTPVTARVLENLTACTVDAVCLLRLELADTTIAVLYGTGERPPPPCPVPVEASDAAFAVEEGDVVQLRFVACEGARLMLQALGR